MKATSDYWKPVFYLLEAEGFECWLLDAAHVKDVPGRPKTDRFDAVWLAKVDLTHYRRCLIGERSRVKQRMEKLLEDAQIKLSAVVSDLFGVSGRAILAAMIAGQRDPILLAELVRGRLRAKIGQLQQALTGHFDEVTGIGVVCAQEIIAEIGIDMSVFPTAAHLASWPNSPPGA